ncbi:LysR substrate-binding domain-containing protein [Oxalobacteraceae bacterium R-40]|uniref:LysR substrate-binding domain-containing protein n=1 Tax=Keguizhuia sedimenti TaxID=3064264 RepID=A0ABU1BQ86_9BURK|nr:LysR substrate-binding domain-containing protein [Oxalobacteraceae bacterium R-40]
MSRINLELDLLKTLVAGIDAGSFARAADKIGRSQSAVSLQMKKLEEQLDVEIFAKQGRSLSLTPAGKILYDYALQMLELHDEAVAAIKGTALHGHVRFGMSADFENSWVPLALARFSRAHAGVTMDIHIERNSRLAEKIAQGELDIALFFSRKMQAHSDPIAHLDMIWIGQAEFSRTPEEALPLLLLEQPCIFHQAAVSALDESGIKWRIAVTSPTQGGLWAAAAAGIGITVRTAISKPSNLANLGKKLGLPSLPEIGLYLAQAPDSQNEVAARLKATVLEVFQEQLGVRGET